MTSDSGNKNLANDIVKWLKIARRKVRQMNSHQLESPSVKAQYR